MFKSILPFLNEFENIFFFFDDKESSKKKSDIYIQRELEKKNFSKIEEIKVQLNVNRPILIQKGFFKRTINRFYNLLSQLKFSTHLKQELYKYFDAENPIAFILTSDKEITSRIIANYSKRRALLIYFYKI